MKVQQQAPVGLYVQCICYMKELSSQRSMTIHEKSLTQITIWVSMVLMSFAESFFYSAIVYLYLKLLILFSKP